MALELQNSDLQIAVTPADGADLPNGRCRQIWIGVAGTLSYQNITGGATLTTTVPAGLFPMACSRVLATGTTATGILAMY